MSDKVQPMSTLVPTLAAKEGEAVEELLGPVAQRMAPALQVRDVLCLRIVTGEWKPNTAILNDRDLARELGVNLETMRKALDLMDGEGLLQRRAVEAAIEKSDKIKKKRDE